MLHDTLAEDRSEFVEIMNIPEVRRADLTALSPSWSARWIYSEVNRDAKKSGANEKQTSNLELFTPSIQDVVGSSRASGSSFLANLSMIQIDAPK